MNTQPVLAGSLVATGTLVAGPAHLKTLYISHIATAGLVTLRDGGASGATILTITTPAVLGTAVIPIPDGGIKFKTDIHATMSNQLGLTAFHNN